MRALARVDLNAWMRAYLRYSYKKPDLIKNCAIVLFDVSFYIEKYDQIDRWS